jgi:4-aminobutyrate aminotransferase-like enzyme
MNIRPVLFAAIFVSAASAAPAQSNNALATYDFNLGGTFRSNPAAAANMRFTRDMDVLRRDGLAQQVRDGGTLTPEHRAELQARLDEINAAYRKSIRDNDVSSVNADGSRR